MVEAVEAGAEVARFRHCQLISFMLYWGVAANAVIFAF